MKKLDTIKLFVSKKAGRTGLMINKYSPEILLAVGVVGIVGSTVLACKATLKVEGIVDDAKEKIDKIKYADKEIDDATYSEMDYKKDMTLVYVQTGVKFVKLYAPAVGLGVVSVGCIMGSHNIMKKRNVALMAAFKLAEQSYADYRKRVVEEFGEEKDRQFHYGIKSETIQAEKIDENGKKKKVNEVVESVVPGQHSIYARFFDESSRQWSKTPEYNLVFLKAQQNYANDLLRTRGNIFLNEVYDLLGMPRSQAGAIVGWVITGDGDNFVDFGMYDLNDPSKRDFVNGYERSILLDFNVDGVIHDLI